MTTKNNRKETYDSQNTTLPDPQSSFLYSKTTIIFIIIRFCLSCRIGFTNDVLAWSTSNVVKSVLINPIYSFDHVLEANALRQIAAVATNRSGDAAVLSFVDAYNQRYPIIHLPPLLLCTIESFLGMIPNIIIESEYWLGYLIRIIATIIDLLIAEKLVRIATKIFRTDDNNNRETTLLEKMPQSIYPELSHVFPITTTTTKITTTTTNTTSMETTTAVTITEKLNDGDRTMNDDNLPLLRREQIPLLIGYFYHCSPFTIISSSAIGSFQNIVPLLLCYAVDEALPGGGSVVWSAFYLSLAAYCDVHYHLFLIPILLFVYQQRNNQRDKTPAVVMVTAFVGCLITLHGLAYSLVGSSFSEYINVVLSTSWYSFGLQHLEPSLSMVWYFSMEVFNEFRLYFTILLGAMPYLLVIPITIRLYHYPAVLLAIMWMLGVLFRPPGTLYGLNIGLCFMLLNPRSLARMPRIMFLVSICAIPVPVCLYMVSYIMWLGPNTGEANFLYFQCLAYNIFIALLFLMFTSASLKRDKALRLTEKLMRQEMKEKVS